LEDVCEDDDDNFDDNFDDDDDDNIKSSVAGLISQTIRRSIFPATRRISITESTFTADRTLILAMNPSLFIMALLAEFKRRRNPLLLLFLVGERLVLRLL